MKKITFAVMGMGNRGTAYAAKIMTLECGLRFLTDYLDGDHYFANCRPGQNLDRCRTQFHMVADMEQKWDKMREIVKEIIT